MKSNRFLFIFILAATFMISACSEDDEANDTPAEPTTEINQEKGTFLAGVYNDEVQMIASEAIISALSLSQSAQADFPSLSPCASIIIDTISYPLNIQVSFGDSNCLCNDGKYRRGSLQLTLTAAYALEGSTLLINTSDYAVNDNEIVGEISITNLGLSTNGKPYFSSTSTIAVRLNELMGYMEISWNSQHFREWTEGFLTPYQPLDDVYLITGSSTGATGELLWTRSIINPLRKEMGCFYYVSGTVEVETPLLLNWIVDYGDGSCDKIIEVTINGNTYTIALP